MVIPVQTRQDIDVEDLIVQIRLLEAEIFKGNDRFAAIRALNPAD